MFSVRSKVTFGLEAKIALSFIEAMRKAGYKVYQELDRCDLVMVKDGQVTAVEAKSQLNLKVLAQAYSRYGLSDYLAILLPERQWRNEDKADREFAREVAKIMGIGIYLVHWDFLDEQAWKDWKPGDPIPPAKVGMLYPPSLIPRTDLSWDKLFIPEAENFSTAGGSGVKAFTAFRLWEIEVRNYVKEHPGLTIRELQGALRPPGIHKKTGKPLVVHKQDIEILSYNLRCRFQGFSVVADPLNNCFETAKVYLDEAYSDKHWKAH